MKRQSKKIKNKNILSSQKVDTSNNKKNKNKTGNFKQISEQLLAKKYFRLFLISILFLSFMLVSYPKIIFDNYVSFGFDQWDYQTLAVNFAKGHGINLSGGIENFEEYHFGHFDKYYNGTMSGFLNNAGHYSFYRTPGYPFIVGVIYKIAGISPIVAKKIQSILLYLMYALLPVFSYRLWHIKGFISGFIASILSINLIGIGGNVILTESTISIFIFLLSLAWLYDFKKNNILSNILFGLITAASLLVKGVFIFVPMVVFLLKIYNGIKSKDKKTLGFAFLYLTFFVVGILPWSIYASTHSNKTIILSTQGERVLLDGNNEYAHGGWTPGWSKHKDSFYNNDNMQDKPTIFRVVNFYLHNPQKFPVLMTEKLIYGFIPFAFLWLLLGLITIEQVRLFINKFWNSKKIEILFIFFIALPYLTYIVYIRYFNYLNFYDKIKDHLYLLLFLFILPFILVLIRKLLKIKPDFAFKIPELFIIMFLNFLLLILVLNGDIYLKNNRYVQVAEFLMIIIFVYQLIEYIKFLTKYFKFEDIHSTEKLIES